jgi:hypothetical protein
MVSSNLQQHMADEDAHVQYVRKDTYEVSGDMIYEGETLQPTRIPLEKQGGFVLMVSFDTPYRPEWQHIRNVAIPKNALTNKGDLLVGIGLGLYATLPVGTTGQVLTVDSSTLTGLKWADPAVVVTCPYSLDFSYECDSGYIALL